MKICVIIPVYNAEKYLDTCIKSIINQSVDFKKHIKLILINDGSTDNSERICLRYKDQYPSNVIYHYSENSGPSRARNKGLQLIPDDCKYTSFLDADDKLEKNAIEKVIDFFKSHPTVHIATIPVYYFENAQGPIKLNSRFIDGSRVINIREEYFSPQFYIGGVFINNDFIKNESLSFDEKMSFWEDALFVNKIILKDGQYGVVSGTKYWYRKRASQNSLVDTSWLKKSRYTDLLNNGYKKLMDLSYMQYESIIPYVQYLIIYHLKLFIFQKHSDFLIKVLNDEERTEFINTVKKILHQFDRKFIIEQDTLKIHKEFMLSLKGENSLLTESDFDNINSNNSIRIMRKSFTGLKLKLEGVFLENFYTLDHEDRIFIHTPFGKKYAQRKDKVRKINIWGIYDREITDRFFLISIPSWTIWFQFGVETKN